MQKLVIGLAVVVAIGGFLWWSMSSPTSAVEPDEVTTARTGGTTSAPSETLNPSVATTTKPTMETPTIAGTPAPEPSKNPAPTGGYKNGTFTGPVVDSVFGPVQVTVTVSGGKITAVSVPVFPNSPGHTTEVSAMAIPQLKKETIAVQSANVDIVSGATQTAEAYQVSLSAALTQAS